MSTNSKKLKTFKSMLSGLTCEKHKIGHLTQQARADLHHDETLAEVDVNAITSFIVNKNADDRLAGLYLIDSICQNVSGKYVPLFEEHIFPLIETTYRYGSSQTRKSLCKILSIWKSRKIFPIEILRNIYKAISNQQSESNTHNPTVIPHPAAAAPPLMNYAPYYAPNINPYHHQQQQQQQQYVAYPHAVINPSGWQAMCLAHNISPTQYESVITELLASISSFIESPYTYRGGLFVETPALKHAGWNCPRSIASELSKSRREFVSFGMDITRKLYFICCELKDCGVNTWVWQSKLRGLSPFIVSDDKRAKDDNVSICSFYNSLDGCRSGSNCKYLHVTNTEAQLRRRLLSRVCGRYEYSDIKFEGTSEVKITTFYTYFGVAAELKKKHTRSISLLYSKKLKVCPNCGLRMSAESFSGHMKWHFDRRNEILIAKRQTGFKSHAQQYGMYRSWYGDEKEWLHANDSNVANKTQTKKEMNPFAMETKEEMNPIVTLNGISQKVICSICNEEFAKTNKEYNAHKDDWILKNACYSDGTNKDTKTRTDIVHRKCYELKKKQSQNDGLKPKLLNKNNPIVRIEMHLNKPQTQQTTKRKRKINHLFAASDDEDEIDTKKRKLEMDCELNEEELAQIEQEDSDSEDEDDADIVLFDPDAYNDAYQRGYGYRGAY
eukprot:75441_1